MKILPRGEHSPTHQPPLTSRAPKRAPSDTTATERRAIIEACQYWARARLIDCPRGEMERGYALVCRHADATKPFASIPRTAYVRLTAALAG